VPDAAGPAHPRETLRTTPPQAGSLHRRLVKAARDFAIAYLVLRPTIWKKYSAGAPFQPFFVHVPRQC